VTITGTTGSLLVAPISPADLFISRKPTKHIDIPHEAIRTLSLRQTGVDIAFAVLLVPSVGDNERADRQNVNANVNVWWPGERVVTVSGVGFTDKITAGRGPLS